MFHRNILARIGDKWAIENFDAITSNKHMTSGACH